jgi:hypothetical protein
MCTGILYMQCAYMYNISFMAEIKPIRLCVTCMYTLLHVISLYGYTRWEQAKKYVIEHECLNGSTFDLIEGPEVL